MAVPTTAQCISRREFTLAAAMAVLSGVAISVSACGGGSSSASPASPSPTGSSTDKVGSISANHGHSAVITSAQLGTAGGITLNIQGSAGHPHTVALTGGELSTIAGSQRVAKESSNDAGHSHTVTFN
jgi:spore coat protein U-like protein